MASTGNITLLRRLHKLYQRTGSETSFGNHLACQMALGLLFLAKGSYTLGTSNQAVAALVISLFPRFPTTSSDNQCHLQAFRHLWVLALESRCLLTKDVETREICPVPMTITVSQDALKILGISNPKLSVMTPCILPEFQMIEFIEVESERYWPLEIDFKDGQSQGLRRLLETKLLYVKRKTGHLSYKKV
jgi:anaphase-promoting complex subunit 1